MVTTAFPFTDTDPQKWHLRVDDGRQWWEYTADSPNVDAKQTKATKYWLGTLTSKDVKEHKRPDNALDAARIGLSFFQQLQTSDGHWAGEYGGPLFLIPGLVIVCHISDQPLPMEQQVELIRYLRNVAHPTGGWGLHIEGEPTVFGTALNYVAMRLLGVEAEDALLQSARSFLLSQGGAVGCPHWGKFWLSVLNVHDWRGMNPVPPELWLLPSWMPAYPGRMWCHCRQVYLPMSYCYAVRLQAKETDLIRQLRQEIYCEPYAEINWDAVRNNVAAVDLYAPHHKLLDLVNWTFVKYEDYVCNVWLRQKALEKVLDQIRAEDLNTKFTGIGPISKMINMLVMWHSEGPQSSTVCQHRQRITDFLWLGADGMRMQGTNGSQLWDTALAVHAIMAGGLVDRFPQEFKDCALKCLQFLDSCQIKQNVPDRERYHRQISSGGFPFSTRDCGWIVSDCTAEGLKAVLALQNSLEFTPKVVTESRLNAAVDVLLNMQNGDGGFASYESRRGPFWLEMMNPSEVFGEIMVDYSYVECTSATIQALTAFQHWYPEYRQAEIKRTVKKAIQFIEGQQRLDGSWYGSWGICFTYAGWFAMEAFACVGRSFDNCDAVRRGCDFLVGKQMPDGGWGESYLSCPTQSYVQHQTSQVVMTAWAVLALMAARYPDVSVIERGIRLIMQRQLNTGEWKQEAIEGVFNKTVTISYPNYKFIFTIWALGKFSKLYGNVKLF